jgi:pimeloyl-ACP methyl ester carboxylesterase
LTVADLPADSVNAEALSAAGSALTSNMSRLPWKGVSRAVGSLGFLDRMVPSALSEDMHRRIAGSKLTIYPDSGHGAIFQYNAEFSSTAIEFI